jgi:hypothetical protein
MGIAGVHVEPQPPAPGEQDNDGYPHPSSYFTAPEQRCATVSR